VFVFVLWIDFDFELEVSTWLETTTGLARLEREELDFELRMRALARLATDEFPLSALARPAMERELLIELRLAVSTLSLSESS